MSVAPSLIEEACLYFGVTEAKHLNDGSQKTVRLVYRGDTPLVLKVIQVGKTHPLALQRAVREVDLLHKLKSDNVVKVESALVELGSPPNGAAWLEEYLDGDDLANRVPPRWSWVDVADMGFQIASGLAELHDKHVVHRDLSSSNIRCLNSGTYKIMDPGFARHELLPRITVEGNPGTPGFMSPEHLKSQPAGPTAFSDIFSLGCLMWLTLTGDTPIPFKGDIGDYARRLSINQVEGMHLLPMLEMEQIDFLLRCLHRQPARRFRDGGEAATKLDGLR